MKNLQVWTRSSFCEAGSCVAVRHVDGEVQVRDSKDPSGPVLSFSETFWDWVLERLAAGESVATIAVSDDGVRWKNAVDGWVYLDFTPEEWAAFTAGVRDGEFDLDRLVEVGS